MQVILPVAGYGTRLKPHTDNIQKTLLPVAGKAGIDHILDGLGQYGFNNFTLIIGHLGQQVIEHTKLRSENFSFIEQTHKFGLGHAVYQGLKDSTDPVLVHLGDSRFKVNFKSFVNSNVNQIAVFKVEDPRRFGVVDLSGKNIKGFYEKVSNPPSNWAIAGLYYFSNQRKLKNALEILIENNMRNKGEYQLTDALHLMLNEGQNFEAFTLDDWYDMGVPQTFLESNRRLLKSHHAVFEDCTLIEPVFIGENCRLSASKIGPYVTIMDNSEIQSCEIEDSIVLSGSKLKNLNFKERIVAGDGSEYC